MHVFSLCARSCVSATHSARRRPLRTFIFSFDLETGWVGWCEIINFASQLHTLMLYWTKPNQTFQLRDSQNVSTRTFLFYSTGRKIIGHGDGDSTNTAGYDWVRQQQSWPWINKVIQKVEMSKFLEAACLLTLTAVIINGSKKPVASDKSVAKSGAGADGQLWLVVSYSLDRDRIAKRFQCCVGEELTQPTYIECVIDNLDLSKNTKKIAEQ